MARLLWFTVHANYFSHTEITDETAAYACGFFYHSPDDHRKTIIEHSCISVKF